VYLIASFGAIFQYHLIDLKEAINWSFFAISLNWSYNCHRASTPKGSPMKMRASEFSSAAVLPDGSMSIGFRSATDSHTLELSRKAQEQLLPALLASEPANLRKFFTATDVQAQSVAEGVLLTFAIRGSVAVRILVPETISHQLLALLTGWARRPEPAADDSRPSTDGTASEQ
jgi:hypothetical protein